MAYERRIEIKVINDGIEVLISDLHVSFEVQRSVTFGENSAIVKIYNVSKDTQNKLLREGGKIQISAGYADQVFGTIFIGQIVDAYSEKVGSVDRVVTLECASLLSLDNPAKSIDISKTFAKDVTASKVIEYLGKKLSLVVKGSDLLKDLKLKNGWTFAGTARGGLQYIAWILDSFGFGLYRDAETLHIYPYENKVGLSVAYLSYESGLISVKEQCGNFANIRKKINKPTDKTISFRVLLNPLLTPISLVEIKAEIEGFFIIQKVNFVGDNFGEDFYCDCVGVA